MHSLHTGIGTDHSYNLATHTNPEDRVAGSVKRYKLDGLFLFNRPGDSQQCWFAARKLYIVYGIEFGRTVTAAARHTIRAQDSSMGAIEHCDPDAAGRVRDVRLF